MEAEKLIAALYTAERLKDTMRHCDTSGGRRESVAEHSWRAALMAYFMKDEFLDADMDKVIRMCLIHDLGECFTGDIPAFQKTAADEKKEEQLLDEWVASLPVPFCKEMQALYQEMGEQQTLEARIYKAIDNMEAVLQHNEADISTWEPHEYELTKNYGMARAQFHPYIRQVREYLRKETDEKIRKAGREISLASETDAEEILALYRSMIGGPADWNQYYPSMETIASDLERNSLFVMKNEQGEIIAAISIDKDDEVESLDCWNKEKVPAAEVSRLCVRSDMQGRGIAKMMMEYVFGMVQNREKKAVHLLVRTGHPAAFQCYRSLGFQEVGNCHMYEKDFLCMEKLF